MLILIQHYDNADPYLHLFLKCANPEVMGTRPFTEFSVLEYLDLFLFLFPLIQHSFSPFLDIFVEGKLRGLSYGDVYARPEPLTCIRCPKLLVIRTFGFVDDVPGGRVKHGEPVFFADELPEFLRRRESGKKKRMPITTSRETRLKSLFFGRFIEGSPFSRGLV